MSRLGGKMAHGVYLVKITDDWTKVGRSGSLSRRLSYWNAHGLETLWSMEMGARESIWLEYAMLRSSVQPSVKQLQAFQRARPNFPNNRKSLPAGSQEWMCMGKDQSISLADLLWPKIQHVVKHVPERNGSTEHGLFFLKCELPPADGLGFAAQPYLGPIPLLEP